MKVTLKKASELARAAIEAANKITVSTNTTISIYSKDTVRDVVKAAREQCLQDDSDARNLLSVAFEIRKVIGQKNAECGVSKALTQREMLDQMERRYQMLLQPTYGNRGEVDDNELAEVAERLSSNKNRIMAGTTGNLRTVEENITVGVMDKATVKQLTDDLMSIRRQKSDLKDTIAGLNLNTTIELGDAWVTELKKHGLIG